MVRNKPISAKGKIDVFAVYDHGSGIGYETPEISYNSQIKAFMRTTCVSADRATAASGSGRSFSIA